MRIRITEACRKKHGEKFNRNSRYKPIHYYDLAREINPEDKTLGRKLWMWDYPDREIKVVPLWLIEMFRDYFGITDINEIIEY